MPSDHHDDPALLNLAKRLPIRFAANQSWVVTRPFFPSSETRIRSVFERIKNLCGNECTDFLNSVEKEFSGRHRDLNSDWMGHFEQARELVPELSTLSSDKKRLLGSFFTMEYAFASAALFNPSIVTHPDQSDARQDSLRFIMSLRATGEGHVSSIIFRSGFLGPGNCVDFEEPSPHCNRLSVSPDRRYDLKLFQRKLREFVIDESAVNMVLDDLNDGFTIIELEHAVEQSQLKHPEMQWLGETTKNMIWLARENYQLSLPPDGELSELVVFPQSDNESRGIEDLRMVRFVEDDHTVRYYGTYTAYNGTHALPQLLETQDFRHLKMHTLNGVAAKNKGMALFPRRIGGQYCMTSRIDGENLFLSFSDTIEFWESAEILQAPRRPWEFMQIGNCGSPIETSEGWLLVTHGVGPMRKYCIGAMLLDRHDPFKVIGELKSPLISPTAGEREGYVPNVVYSCGSIAYNETLFVPYAMSDSATGFAVIPIEKLLDELL